MDFTGNDAWVDDEVRHMKKFYLKNPKYRSILDKFFSCTNLFIPVPRKEYKSVRKSRYKGLKARVAGYHTKVIKPLLPGLASESSRTPLMHNRHVEKKIKFIDRNYDEPGTFQEDNVIGKYFVLYAISLVNPDVATPNVPDFTGVLQYDYNCNS